MSHILNLFFPGKCMENKGQCTTGPMATTVHSSKKLIVKLHAKNQKILEQGSEYSFEKVHFEPKFDLLTPIRPGQDFSRRQNIHSPKCLISVLLHAKNLKKSGTWFRRYF